ncbi:MAG TPA: hypothetical protein VKV40_11695 [Ktedonobacteraceae bacterium]|nr:hypothetical protein [Ktedonobacteraceae bacterium]
MRTRSLSYYVITWVLICSCLVVVVTACGNAGVNTPQHVINAVSQRNTSQNLTVPMQVQGGIGTPGVSEKPGTQGTPAANPSPTPGNPPGGYTPTPGSPPGPVPPGNGGIPAAFPHYFSFGVMNPAGSAYLLAQQRSQNGTAYAFRYEYLTGGVNTGRGWETWNSPPGQYAMNYMQESAQYGYMPVFVYYEICLSNGPHPSSYCGGNNIAQDTGNLADAATMHAYFANWVLMLQKIAAFGKPVLVIVEPDLWGFLQNASNGTNNAATIPASVASSGFPDAAGFPNNVQGFAWALLHMRDKYAPNAILALHASTWAAGIDIATYTGASLNVAAVAAREAQFLNSAGIVGNPSGVSSWNVISNDVADFDSGQPGSRGWWDRYNRTFPNFARYLQFIGYLSQDTHRRIVMWQVPMGNQYFDTMNNSPGHYQDNRAEYILGNVPSFAAAGIIAVLFGPGNYGTMNIDAMHDGVTNPAPISTYECNDCNNHQSVYPDDDGGYLRIFVGLYMKNPYPIS